MYSGIGSLRACKFKSFAFRSVVFWLETIDVLFALIVDMNFLYTRLTFKALIYQKNKSEIARQCILFILYYTRYVVVINSNFRY